MRCQPRGSASASAARASASARRSRPSASSSAAIRPEHSSSRLSWSLSTAIAAAPSSCSAAASRSPCSNSATPWCNSTSARSASPVAAGARVVLQRARQLARAGDVAAGARRQQGSEPAGVAVVAGDPGEPRLRARGVAERQVGRGRGHREPRVGAPRSAAAITAAGAPPSSCSSSQWSATSAAAEPGRSVASACGMASRPSPASASHARGARVQLGLEPRALQPQPGAQQLGEQAVVAEPGALTVERHDEQCRCARAARAGARRRCRRSARPRGRRRSARRCS